MLNNRKLVLDTLCDVYNELKSYADAEFWDFNQHQLINDAVYVIGRNQFNLNTERIKQIAADGSAKIVLSIPGEGSETLVTLCLLKGIKQLVEDQKILLVTGGDLPAGWPHILHEYFLPKVFDFDENVLAAEQAKEIFTKTVKPYKFLFLNGRTRPHRKYLLERFDVNGLLQSALWTNLDRGLQLIRQPNGGYLYTDQALAEINIQFLHNNQNLMYVPRDIHYLPKQYEVDRYQHRVDLPLPNTTFMDDHLFDKEWGEIYVNPLPYIDTYFSVVTETVFNYPYSFRTEKIWKPVAMAHPFVVVANTGYYRDLHRLGFQTFGHLIDESFDQIENSQDRIERVAKVVEDLCQQDLASFLKECYNICKYNQQHYTELRTQVPGQFSGRFKQFICQYINE